MDNHTFNQKYLKEAVEKINKIITSPRYNNSQIIHPDDVEFREKTFGSKRTEARRETLEINGDISVDITYDYNPSRFSKLLFDIYYPRPSEKCFYHYTKVSALKHILKQRLRLKPLSANENDEEFKTFYNDHNFLGYFEHKDENDVLMKDSLMQKIYAFCMASKEGLKTENENALWRSFADNGHGIRIEFEVATNHPDFRKVFYKDDSFNKQDLVINKIRSFIKTDYNRELFIYSISKMGAFYLPGTYKIENEVRFVVKKHTDAYDFKYEEKDGYLILPFKSVYAEFKISNPTHLF